MSNVSSESTAVGYEQCYRCARDATLRWRCSACPRGGPCALCHLCAQCTCPHCGRSPQPGDVWTISELPSDIASMTDAMSAMQWENCRAELRRITLHGQQLWKEQVPLMIAHIQERCREAAHAGIEKICVDPRALLYEFRLASLHHLPRKVFENKYALDAIWSQLSS